MPLKITKKAPEKAAIATTSATVSKTQPDGSESHAQEILGHESIMGEPVSIEVAVGLTRNLGNFESLKFHVGITMPVANNEKEIEEAYTVAKDWVDAKVNEINAEVDTLVGSKG